MGVKERKQRERSEVREKILDAALDFFATEGHEGVTMRALADAIEYTPPVIYSHFRDKDAIIASCATASFGRSQSRSGPSPRSPTRWSGCVASAERMSTSRS